MTQRAFQTQLISLKKIWELFENQLSTFQKTWKYEIFAQTLDILTHLIKIQALTKSSTTKNNETKERNDFKQRNSHNDESHPYHLQTSNKSPLVSGDTDIQHHPINQKYHIVILIAKSMQLEKRNVFANNVHWERTNWNEKDRVGETLNQKLKKIR
jgi:hypothetical protein